MSAPKVTLRAALLWTDFPEAAIPMRDKLAENGISAAIRDARYFDRDSVEPARTLYFMGARRADEIIAHYRGPGYRGEFPEVQVVRLDLNGEVQEGEPAPPEPVAQGLGEMEADALSARIAEMGDDELRVFVRGTTGEPPAEGATRDEMIALLRPAAAPAAVTGQAGQVVSGARRNRQRGANPAE